MAILTGNRVYSARNAIITWNSKELAEATAFKLVTKMNKTKLPRVGAATDATAVDGGETTGSLKIYRVNNVIQKKLADSLKKGKWPTFTIMSTEQNKDTGRWITVVAEGVSFDDITWADWDVSDSRKQIELTFTCDKEPSFKHSDEKRV